MHNIAKIIEEIEKIKILLKIFVKKCLVVQMD